MTSINHIPFATRLQPAVQGGGFAMEDYWVWCGSAIQGEDGRYHLFVARWPKVYKFLPGYQSYSEIVRAVADTPEGPYTFAEVVLGDRGAAYWDGRMTHNPTVIRWNGRYLLFYIGTTFDGPKPTAEELLAGPDMYPWYRSISIGVAESESILGPWRRPARPLLTARPGHWDATVVTNPSPCVTADGRLLLYYRTYIPDVGCKLGLAIYHDLTADPEWRSDAPLIDGDNMTLEDPCVFRIDDHYEMIAKDLNGQTTGELNAGAHLLSPDGINWELAPIRKAYSRDVLWSDGQLRHMGSFERPQLLLQDGHPTHLFAAMADGPGQWQQMNKTWNVVIPLGKGESDGDM
ncbi:MAG: glycoside hydrolase family protein [bacterium]